VASAVRSRLGPNRNARNTIEARRRAESVDNNCDNRSRHNDDHGRRRRHDVMTIASAAGRPTSGVHGLLARPSAT
jgi:hypothetical protein